MKLPQTLQSRSAYDNQKALESFTAGAPPGAARTPLESLRRSRGYSRLGEKTLSIPLPLNAFGVLFGVDPFGASILAPSALGLSFPHIVNPGAALLLIRLDQHTSIHEPTTFKDCCVFDLRKGHN